jgi:peptidoglycan/LPS O-acetylase OafA/YrhL
MPKTDNARVDSIDGMRGFGSVVVLLFHVFLTFNLLKSPPFYAPNIAYNGNLAVQLFFVLSGFSLSIGFLSKEKRGSDGNVLLVHLQRMAAARYFRLALPAFASGFIVFIIAKTNLNYYQHLPEELRNPWWGWAYGSYTAKFSDLIKYSFYDIFFPLTFVPFVNYNHFYFNTNLWTMSIEFPASYMVFVFLALFGVVRSRIYLCLGVIPFFCFFDSMYGFFFAGVALADFHTKGWSAARWQRPLAVGFLLLLFAPEIKHTWSQVVYCSAIVFCSLYSVPVRAVFSSRIFRYLGRISFSLYLVHMPIVISLQSYLFLVLGGRLPAHEVILLSGGVTVVVSFAAAHLFSFIDEWAIGVSHKFARLVLTKG